VENPIHKENTMRSVRKYLSFLLLPAITALAEPELIPESESTPKEVPGQLTLQDALVLTLQRSPGLAAYAYDARIADAQILQAGLRPNPELALSLEDVRWNSADFKTSSLTVSPLGAPFLSRETGREDGGGTGLSEAEFTATVSQTIETGGKRRKRIALAEAEKEVAQAGYAVARLDVLSRTSDLFANVLAAQDEVSLADDLVSLARDVRDVFATRVEAGKVSPIEGNQANLALAAAELVLAGARAALEDARIALSGQWGDTTPQFASVSGNWPDDVTPPPFATLRTHLADHPAAVEWTAQRLAYEAAFDLARAESKPDPTFTFGLRFTGVGDGSGTGYARDITGQRAYTWSRSEADRDAEGSLVFGFSIPLPVFSRNQGNIRAAELRIERSDLEAENALQRLETQLQRAYTRLRSTHDQMLRIRDAMLPGAEETFGLVQEGYRQGKFGYLEVLTAQQSLFDMQVRLLESRAAYHRAWVETEWIVGWPLTALAANVMHDTAEDVNDVE
jgi:cobalt-zinc-cadmium efflux system outer membrane protein